MFEIFWRGLRRIRTDYSGGFHLTRISSKPASDLDLYNLLTVFGVQQCCSKCSPTLAALHYLGVVRMHILKTHSLPTKSEFLGEAKEAVFSQALQVIF